MGFYDEISKYYDYVFPAEESQVNLLLGALEGKKSKVLDVACGSGEYSVRIARKGHKVWATDIDNEMVRCAKEKAKKLNLDIITFQSDMRYINEVISEKFDLIFCIGNSIVHLGNHEEIKKAIKEMKSMLLPKGKLILQIINFDRIINENVMSLPTLVNEEKEIEFIRRYNHIDNKINFDTILKVGKKEEYINSIELLPLLSDDLKEMLKETGFIDVHLYGDFQKRAYKKDSFLTITESS